MRLITLNYCPMGCTFCSSTNFLHEAQGSVAPIARLDADECLSMIERIVAAHPRVRTIIFQDDIFVFTKDKRVLPLCEAIVAAKAARRAAARPAVHQHQPHRCDDARSASRPCAAPAFACSASASRASRRNVLAEFNKAQIHRHIEPMLAAALELGITPFLDLILSSPRATLEDVAETLREAYRWLRRGCEVGMYPYVIPFSGAALARDPALAPHTDLCATRTSPAPAIEWDQPAKILPIDPIVREVDPAHRTGFRSDAARSCRQRAAHLPSRVRSLVWILARVPMLAEHGIAHRRRARGARRARSALAASPEGDGATRPSRVA